MNFGCRQILVKDLETMSKIIKRLGLLLVLLLAVAFIDVSCSFDAYEIEPVTRTKVFTLGQVSDTESGTKVVETAGRTFSWSEGDVVQYYKLIAGGSASSGATQVATVNGSGPSVTFNAVYTHPTEKELVTVFLGSSLTSNTVNQLQKDRFTVAGGIPSTQDGTMVPYMVAAARGVIETSQSLAVKHMQTYISFSVNANSTVTGTFNKIIISDKSGTVNIAGNATYVFNASTGELSSCSIASGGSKTITISGTVTAGKVYYAAVCPVNFTGGLRVTLYNGSTKLAYATTGTGNKLTAGKINDLGTLDFHWEIPASTSPEITPEYSSICNTGGLQMTKKLWCTFAPSDCSGVTWKIVKGNNGTSTYTSASDIASKCGTITPGAKETYDGKEQFTATVTPKCAKGWLLVKAELAGDEKLKDYALVKIDDFIDIGSTSVLWARSNLKGGEYRTGKTAAKAALCTNTSDFGDYYQFGGRHPLAIGSDATYLSEYLTLWGGTSRGNWGKYDASHPTPVILESSDDICTLSYDTWHIPTWAEVQDLTPDSRTNASTIILKGTSYLRFSSSKIGFTDCYVLFPFNGLQWGGSDRHPGYFEGGPFHTDTDMFVLSSNIKTSAKTVNIPGISCESGQWGDAYNFPMVFGKGTFNTTGLSRTTGWGIRPVCKKSGFYPTIGVSPYTDPT